MGEETQVAGTSSSGGSNKGVILAVVIVIVLLLVGAIFYKTVLKNRKVQESTNVKPTSSQTVQNNTKVTPVPTVGTSDASLDQDTQDIQNSLQKVDSNLNSVDSDLNNQAADTPQ